jgi:hypothetical protein
MKKNKPSKTARHSHVAHRRFVSPQFRVVALFVQPDGCYSNLPWVDAWPQERDARKYDGNLPVVAHPPCQLWGNLACVNYARWGGEHNRPGNDAGCFAAAVAAVKRCGGVLEHPAMSKAFMAHGITPPATMGWQRTMDGGWVCEVWQSAYSHRANKKTWLYYFGENPPAELKWERIVGTHQVGQECRQGRRKLEPWRNKPTLSKREANATPESFRDALLALALRATQHQANGAAMTLPAKAELNRPIAVRFGNWLADESMKT